MMSKKPEILKKVQVKGGVPGTLVPALKNGLSRYIFKIIQIIIIFILFFLYKTTVNWTRNQGTRNPTKLKLTK